jgi:hypothetical protein
MCKLRHEWCRGHCGVSGCGHAEAFRIKRCNTATARERRELCPNPRPMLRLTDTYAMGCCCPCLGWAELIPGAFELVNPGRVDAPR